MVTNKPVTCFYSCGKKIYIFQNNLKILFRANTKLTLPLNKCGLKHFSILLPAFCDCFVWPLSWLYYYISFDCPFQMASHCIGARVESDSFQVFLGSLHWHSCCFTWLTNIKWLFFSWGAKGIFCNCFFLKKWKDTKCVKTVLLRYMAQTVSQ